MSINQKRRILSETITSVDDPIEWTQKGEVVMTKSAGEVAFVPTTITKPKVITVVPLMNKLVRSVSTAATLTPTLFAELNTALTPESGFKLYTGASAYASGSYLTSASVKNCKLGQLFLSDGKLYRMKALKTASNSASAATIGAVLASPSYKAVFVEEVPYTDNAKFIKLSNVTTQTTIAFSFEIKGY